MRECEPSPPSPQEFYQRFPLDTETVRRAFLSVEELKALEPSLHEVQPVSVISNDQTTPQSSVNSFEAFPTKLGSYQILSEFARGGMGILYKARHAELDRIVALKVIKSGQLASQWELSRFHNEAKAIASLDHPNIVPVFEVGEHSGFHYLAMPFVDGENLADRIRDQPLKPRAAAEIACQIAVAVNYAHEHGIIHRDLKPRNILLEDSGIVRVTDFGLAKIIHLDPNDDDSQDLTLTGQVVGTPAYMAPEQALGKPSKRSDIYAIGSVLYTLLTGRPPFQSATLLETLRQLQDVEPVEPRRFNTQIPRDLETITLKCLSKNPDSRYSTAGDLADDLKRFLDKKPIQARPVSQFEHLLRWVKRQPVVAGLITATIVSLSVGLAVSTTYYSLARRNESLARNNEQLASANLDVATATVKQYLTEVASSPELKEKGLETLRKTLLSTAQDFYQKLESQPGQSEMLQSRLADTRHSLALIRFELGEFDTSRILYDKTLESYRSLAMQFPSAVDYLRKVALVLADRAKLDGTDKLDDLKEATSVFRQVFAVTHEPIDQARVASALAHLGMHYTDIAKADDEEATYTEVETLCSEFLPKFDQLGMKTEAVELLRVFDRLALYLQHHGRFDGAEKWLLNVLELADKMAQQRPNDPTVLLVVARANKNLGLVYAKRVRHDDASLRFKAADTIFQRLTDEHPLILEYLDGQASNLMNSGGMESTRKEWSVALGLLQRALACQKKLVEKQPDSFEYCAALPIFYSTLGNVATSQGRIDEALEYLRKGIEAKDIAKAMRPNDIQFAYFGAALTNNLANAYRAQGRYEEALPIYLSVIESVRQLTERSPTVDAYSKILSIACHNLALTQTKLGDNARAIASDSEAKATIEKLLSRNPDSTDYRTLKMQIHIGLGQSNVQAFFLEDAKREFSEANMQLAKLMDSATNLTPYQNNLGMICLGLAQIAEQV